VQRQGGCCDHLSVSAGRTEKCLMTSYSLKAHECVHCHETFKNFAFVLEITQDRLLRTTARLFYFREMSGCMNKHFVYSILQSSFWK